MLALAVLDRPLFVEWSHRVKYMAIDVISYSFNALIKTPECETFLKHKTHGNQLQHIHRAVVLIFFAHPVRIEI